MPNSLINIWSFAEAPPGLRCLFHSAGEPDWLAEVSAEVDRAEIETVWLLCGNVIQACMNGPGGSTIYFGSYSSRAGAREQPGGRQTVPAGPRMDVSTRES
jgi:hypothetical protein